MFGAFLRAFGAGGGLCDLVGVDAAVAIRIEFVEAAVDPGLEFGAAELAVVVGIDAVEEALLGFGTLGGVRDVGIRDRRRDDRAGGA